jgi:hypothetical protein
LFLLAYGAASSFAPAPDLARAANVPSTNPSHTPFVTVLLRNWNRWDTNNDGQLSGDEIDRAVADPTVKGDDAAAAGTLKLMWRWREADADSLTRNYFSKYEKAAQAGAASKSNDSADWDGWFASGQIRLGQSGGAWPTEFNLDAVSQGPLGDCFLVATIGSMVTHDPGEVRRLIRPHPDGSYHVTIPVTTPFDLAALTPSQLVIASTTGGQGDWLAVIEQAVGKYNEKKATFADAEATDSISDGGRAGETMSLLTGNTYTCIHMWTSIADRQRRADKDLPTLRKELTAATHDGRAITADVLFPELSPLMEKLTGHSLPKLPPDINTRHVYAVTGYDADTDMVEIWNPHGQYFRPAGPDGLENGYTTTRGKFKIPLKEAYSFFTDFIFETATPLPPGTAPRW